MEAQKFIVGSFFLAIIVGYITYLQYKSMRAKTFQEHFYVITLALCQIIMLLTLIFLLNK